LTAAVRAEKRASKEVGRAEKRAAREAARAEKWAAREAARAEGGRGLGIGGFLAILLFLIVAGSLMLNSGDDPAAKQLAQTAIGRVGLGTGWDHVEVTTAKQNEYVLKLVYRGPPSDVFVVSQDTRKLALAVLSELTARGRHPSHEQTFLWVWAQRPAGTGETGAELVQIYGHMEYDYHTDQLEFKPWKP
jgi:hypothetical protein